MTANEDLNLTGTSPSGGDHNGQRYWLCCGSCGPLFDADPDRYATAA